jgi:hypothetical protein
LIFFDSLVPATGRVILGDGKTSLPIQGIGTIRLLIDGNELFVDNVCYIPDLSESIYSLFLHVKCPNHGLQSSYDHGLHISFPTFTTQAVLGEHDIYLNAVPGNTTIKCSSLLPPTSTSSTTAISSICRHTKSASSVLCTESTQRDNILTSLQQYNDDIKTKRQLNFEVPAGFCHEGYFQRMVRDVKNSSRVDLPSDDCLRNPLPPTTPIHADASQDINLSDSLPNESSPVSVPILRCVDKPSSHLPARITLTEDFIRASVGFRCIEMMKSHLKQLYQDTIIIDTLPADAVLDQGEFANLKKTPRNTTPVPRPSCFGEVMHMDIVFGPDIAVGNIHYGLLFTDRYSRMTYLYPLQNLTLDTVKQLESFFAHLGFSPR